MRVTRITQGRFAGNISIRSTTTGDTGPRGNKVVKMRISMRRYTGKEVIGVRLCYQLSNTRSFVTQIRLAQVERETPLRAVVRLDDGKDLRARASTCVDSRKTSIDPKAGDLLLSLRVNFQNTGDQIRIHSVGLYTVDVR